MSYASSMMGQALYHKLPVGETTDDLARKILQNWNRPTAEIKIRCNCTAEQVRAVSRREKYWREKLSMPHINPCLKGSSEGGKKHKTYTAEQKESATQLGFLIGPTEAAKQTGVTMNTIRVWMRKKDEVG